MQIMLPAPADFSFHETVSAHGWRRLAPFHWDEAAQVLQRPEELPSGAVVLLNIHANETHIIVDTAPGALSDDDRDVLERRVRRMLQCDLTLADFHTYCRAQPALAPIAARRQGRLLRCPTLWEDAVKVIATTNTTWAQTIAMCARLVEHFGALLPHDPARHTFPSPERVAAVPFDTFASLARMGYRSAYVHALATRIAAGELDLEAWQGEPLSADTLRKRLLSLPGIGPYGAACLLLYLGRPEHVNADSWARTLVSQETARPASDKDVHAFFAAHGAWQGLVYTFYPWRPKSD